MVNNEEIKNSQALRAKLQTIGDRVPHLLIAGDSYSDINFGKNWIQLLQQIIPLRCIGVVANGNYDIWKSLKKETWDLLIVNLSHQQRLSRASIREGKPAHQARFRFMLSYRIKKHEDLILQFTKRIMSLQNAIFWSPFPFYEHWKDVHSVMLKTEDGMWSPIPNAGLKEGYVGCHYTQLGNKIVCEKMCGWILDWLNKK